jgi:hypothetical protein
MRVMRLKIQPFCLERTTPSLTLPLQGGGNLTVAA